MSKVRVQDATKELSSSVGQLYETVSKSRKRALEALNSLRKLEETAKQKERELKAQEDAKKAEATAALIGGAYTAEPPVAQEAAASEPAHEDNKKVFEAAEPRKAEPAAMQAISRKNSFLVGIVLHIIVWVCGCGVGRRLLADVGQYARCK